jgi:hypothetical protein
MNWVWLFYDDLCYQFAAVFTALYQTNSLT